MSRWLFGELAPVTRRHWCFRDGAAYEIGPAGSGWIALIPADFVFDVSAPWWTVWALKLTGLWKRMTRPAGLHDWARQDPAWSLWFGDLIFCDAMQAEGAREPGLTVCWWAVRTNDNRG